MEHFYRQLIHMYYWNKVVILLIVEITVIMAAEDYKLFLKIIQNAMLNCFVGLLIFKAVTILK